jgi:hypothetical protein
MRIASSIAFLSSYRAQIIRHGGQRDILHDAVSLSPIVKFSFAVQDAFHVSISQPPVTAISRTGTFLRYSLLVDARMIRAVRPD